MTKKKKKRDKPWLPDDTQKRKQVLFRIWSDDLIKLKLKVANDATTVQYLYHGLTQEYLQNNPDIMKIVKKYAKKSDSASLQRYKVNEDEAERIFRKLDQFSPLDDLDIEMGDYDN